ncbi:MAG: hypothetical protein KDI88_17650 [Gammaproteobacteria bacterium]|nr:hypothetical protein [Gammaproteobacteria bacterium]
MSKHYEKHAEEITAAFLELLDDEVAGQISQENRNELAMLIEASISTAVFDQLEHAADEVAALSSKLRHYAEHYDKASA